MKRNIIAFAAALALAAGAATTAQAVEFDVGPGGVYVGPQRHHYDAYNRYEGRYGYGNCRVIVDRRTNRFGEDVTVRRRVCD